MYKAGETLIWRHSGCTEFAEYLGEYFDGRAAVRTFDGSQFNVPATQLEPLGVPLDALRSMDELARVVSRYVEYAPSLQFTRRCDPRMHARATVALLGLLQYASRFEQPARVYWATVALLGEEKHAYDCGHRHRRRHDAVTCALASGPRQTVVRWCRGALDVHSDAEVALWLWELAQRDPTETHLLERWNDQRVETVARLSLGEGIAYKDGSELGGFAHGKMDSEKQDGRDRSRCADEDHAHGRRAAD